MSYLQIICQHAGYTFGLNPYHVSAMVDLESNWVRCAASGAGAHGLLQLICSTAQAEGFSGPCPGDCTRGTGLYNVDTNLYYGSSYIKRFFNGANSQWSCVSNTIVSHKWGTPTIDNAYLNNVLLRLNHYGKLKPEQH